MVCLPDAESVVVVVVLEPPDKIIVLRGEETREPPLVSVPVALDFQNDLSHR